MIKGNFSTRVIPAEAGIQVFLETKQIVPGSRVLKNPNPLVVREGFLNPGMTPFFIAIRMDY